MGDISEMYGEQELVASVARVVVDEPSPLLCGDCGAPLVRRISKHGPFFGCSRFPECRGTHGCHADGRPMGVPGDAETRAARVEAHAAFDRLWKSGAMSRSAAYRWLSRELGFEAHISSLTREQCAEVVRLARCR